MLRCTFTRPQVWANHEAPNFKMQVFEVDAARSQPDGFSLQVEPPRASDLSRRICALLADLRAGRANHASCFVVRQGESPLTHPCHCKRDKGHIKKRIICSLEGK